MPTSLGLRERKKRDRLKRISKAAAQMFTERCFHDVTTQEVAAAAKVGTGTLFRYAPTKGELLLMVAVDQFDGIDAANHDTGDPIADILSLFTDIVSMIQSRPDNAMIFYQELIFGAPGPNRERALELVRGLHEEIATVLSRHERLEGAAEIDELARTVANASFMEVLRTSMYPNDLEHLQDSLYRRIHTVLYGHLAGIGAIQ